MRRSTATAAKVLPYIARTPLRAKAQKSKLWDLADQRFIRVADVTRIIHCTESQVRAWILGDVDGFATACVKRFGNRVWIDREKLIAFMETR